jgi:hypothetical protein
MTIAMFVNVLMGNLPNFATVWQWCVELSIVVRTRRRVKDGFVWVREKIKIRLPYRWGLGAQEGVESLHSQSESQKEFYV